MFVCIITAVFPYCNKKAKKEKNNGNLCKVMYIAHGVSPCTINMLKKVETC